LKAPAEPVKVTEADRIAWLRQFLSALDQWTTCLDSLKPNKEDLPPASQLHELPAPEPESPVAAAASTGPSSQQELAVYAATQQAQQAQYLQQFQFWQQMRVHEAQRGSKSVPNTQPPVQGQTRFKDNFRPMRLCKHLMTLGFCRQSEQCTFAHNYEELHLSSPDLPKLDEKNPTSTLAEQAGSTPAGNDPGGLPDLRLKKKKELCGRFMRGYCSLGKVCSFAHGEEELNTVGLAVCGKVKTQLCRNWEAGRCIYGANCNNAHGEQEIGTKRPPPELAPPSKRRREDEDKREGNEPGAFTKDELNEQYAPEEVAPIGDAAA